MTPNDPEVSVVPPVIPTQEELLTVEPPVAPTVPFSKYEREFLSSFDIETREILMSDPLAVRNATRALKATELQKNSDMMSYDDALRAADELLRTPEVVPQPTSVASQTYVPKATEGDTAVSLVADDVQLESPEVVTKSLIPEEETHYMRDAAIGLARVPSTGFIRLADVMKTTVVSWTAQVLDRQWEISGGDLFSDATLKQLSTRLDSDTEEVLFSYGGLAPKGGAVTDLTTEVGVGTVGYLALGAVLATAPAVAAITAVGAGGARIIGAVGPRLGAAMSTFGKFLELELKMATVAGTIGPKELLTEMVAKVSTSEFGEKLAQSIEDSSETARIGGRIVENLAFAKAINVAVPYLKSGLVQIMKQLDVDPTMVIPTLKQYIRLLNPPKAVLPEFPPATFAEGWQILPDFPEGSMGQQPSLKKKWLPPVQRKAAFAAEIERHQASLSLADTDAAAKVTKFAESIAARDAAMLAEDAAAAVKSNQKVAEISSDLLARIDAHVIPEVTTVAEGTVDINIPKIVPEVVEVTPEVVIKKVTKTKTSKVKPLEPAPESTSSVASEVPPAHPLVTPDSPLSKEAETRRGLTGDSWQVKLGKNASLTALSRGDAEVIAAASKGALLTNKALGEKLFAAGIPVTRAKSYAKAINSLRDEEGKWLNRSFDAETKTFVEEGYNASVKRWTDLKATAPAGSPMPPFKRGSSGQYAPLGTLLGIPIELAKWGIPKVADPLVAIGLAGAADFASDDINLDKTDYLVIAGVAMGLHLLGSEVTQMMRTWGPLEKSSIKAMMNTGMMGILSVAKGATQVTPDLQRTLVTISEDLLSGSVPIANQWLDRIERAMVPSAASVVNTAVDVSPIVNNFSTGMAEGIPALIHMDILSTPYSFYNGLTEAVTHVGAAVNNQRLSPAVEALTVQRFQKFTTDFNIGQTGIDILDDFASRIHPNNSVVKNRQIIMVTLDSIERKLLSKVGSTLYDLPAMETTLGRSKASSVLAGVRMFRLAVSDLTNMYSSVVHGATNQRLTAKFIEQIPDSMTKGINLKRWALEVDSQVPYIKGFVDSNGVIPEHLRLPFYEFISSLENPMTTKAAYKSFLAGTYHMMLSSPNLFKNSFVGNTLSQVRLLSSQGLATVTHGVLGDTNAVLAKDAFFSAYIKGLSQGVAGARHTLKTGLSYFDPLGDKVLYKATAVGNNVAALGGTDRDTPIMLRAISRLGELVGVTPGGIMKALDVLYQIPAHAGHLAEIQMNEAIKVSEGSKGAITIATALANIQQDIKLSSQHSVTALDLARSSVFKGQPVIPTIQGSSIGYSKSIPGEVIESLVKVQKAHPVIGLANAFLSTSLFAKLLGTGYDPLFAPLIEATVLKGSSIPWAKVFNPQLINSLPTEVRNQANRHLVDWGAKITTGTMMSALLLTTMASLGYHYVSPMFSVHQEDKNKGAQSRSFTNPTTGKTIDLSLFEDWTSPLAIVDSTVRVLSGDESFVTKKDGITAGLITELIFSNMTPETVADFLDTTKRTVGNPDEEGAKVLQSYGKLMTDVMMRMNPQILKMVEDWSNDVVHLRAKTPADLVKPSEPRLSLMGKTTGSSPMVPFGSMTTRDPDDLGDALAKSGVDISNPYPVKHGGLEVTDMKLANEFIRDRARVLEGNKGDIMAALREAKTPEEKLKVARKAVSNGSEVSRANLWNTLEAHVKSLKGETTK